MTGKGSFSVDSNHLVVGAVLSQQQVWRSYTCTVSDRDTVIYIHLGSRIVVISCTVTIT